MHALKTLHFAGVVLDARAFVFYRYFSCSFVSARGLRLSGAGGDVGVGYAVLIFEWLTRVAMGSKILLGLSLLFNETTHGASEILSGKRENRERKILEKREGVLWP